MLTKSSIIDQLQQAIRDSGQTEYGIAKASGVSQSVVNRFINGERGISFETAAKLCTSLGLKLELSAQQKRQSKAKDR